eukprot:Skav234092  [mRNA]  locus=scaffold212:184947:194573:- [translate_table: standard]
MTKSGWRCYTCWVPNGKTAEFCQSCGRNWREVATQNNQQPWQQPSTPRKGKGKGKQPKERGRAEDRSQWDEERARSVSAKRKEAKERKKAAKAKAKAAAKANEGNPVATPFGQAGITPFPSWPSQPADGASPFQASATQAALAASTATNQELLLALKNMCASSSSEAPTHVKELIERTEKDGAKQITRDLHAATTALGRAQKNLKEAQAARRAHRLQWIQHLQESVRVWELQLQDYRRRQAELQDVAARASAETATAQKLISSLNIRIGSSEMEEQAVDVDEQQDVKLEQEEAQARGKLEKLLRTCASSTGVVPPEAIPINSDSDVDGEEGRVANPNDQLRHLHYQAYGKWDFTLPSCCAASQEVQMPPSQPVDDDGDTITMLAAQRQALALRWEVLQQEWEQAHRNILKPSDAWVFDQDPFVSDGVSLMQQVPEAGAPASSSASRDDAYAAENDLPLAVRGDSPDAVIATRARQRFPVMVYRMERRPVRLLVGMADYEDLLQNVAALLGVDGMRVIGLHHVAASMLGDPPDVRNYIFQCRGDLLPGSPACIIIVDLIFHDPVAANTPMTTRLTAAVNQWMSRSQLLDALDLGGYCREHRDRCLLFVNNQLWHLQDRLTRRLVHGDYVRCEVPPPLKRLQAHPGQGACSVIRTAFVENPIFDVELDERTGSDRTPHSSNETVDFDRPEPEEEHLEPDENQLLSTLISGPGLPLTVLPTYIENRLEDDDLVEPWEPPRLSTDEVVPLPPLDALQAREDAVREPETFARVLLLHRPAGDHDPPLYRTWFLHPERHDRCDVSRSVLLPLSITLWEEAFRRTWADMIAPVGAVTYHLVRPDPPRGDDELIAGHIIVVQAESERCKAVLATIQQPDSAIRHFAQLLPLQTTRYDLIIHAGLAHQCIRCHLAFRCTISKGAGLVSWTSHYFPQNGDGLRFVLEEAGNGIDVNTPLDFGQGETVFWPEEPAVLDQIHDIMPDLVDRFGRRGVPIYTWFLHHGRTLRCDEPRLAFLDPQPDSWASDMVRVWQDRLEQGQPVAFRLIRPTPIYSGFEPQTFHVLLSQADALQPDRRGVVFSSLFGWEFANVAVSVMDVLTPEAMIWYVDRFQRCGPSIGSWDCSVNYVFQLRYRLYKRAPMEVDEDMTNFLQAPLPPMPQQAEAAIDFHDVIVAFEEFDAHFTLPHFALEGHDHCFAWKPQCLDWIRLPWFTYDRPVHEIVVYYDGSWDPRTGSGGCAAACFVAIEGAWYFAGAISSALVNEATGGWAPSVTFGFDNVSVGKQAEGAWQGRKRKQLVHTLRGFALLCEARFNVSCEGWHIKGHHGEPGNELVDSLAFSAMEGKELGSHDNFLRLASGLKFSRAAASFWNLFKPLSGGRWDGHQLKLPLYPTTSPAPTLLHWKDDRPLPLADADLSVTFASYNVLSLKPTADGAFPNSWCSDFTDLIDQWQSGQLQWKPLVKKVWQTHLLQERIACEARVAHGKFFAIIDASAGSTEPVWKRQDASGLSHPCHCGKVFRTPQGLATHKRLVHSEFSLEHGMVTGATCAHCLRFFWSSARLQQHLAYVSRRTGVNECFQALSRQGLCSAYAALPRDAAMVGLNRVDALQAEGPLPQPRDWMLEEIAELEAQIDLDDPAMPPMCSAAAPSIEAVQDALTEAQLVDGEAEQLIADYYFELMQEFDISRHRARASGLQARLRHLREVQGHVVPHRPVRRGTANQKERIQTALHVPRAFATIGEWHNPIRTMSWTGNMHRPALPVLRAADGTLYYLVVHLFSGRRRVNDFHDFLKQWADRTGRRVLVLSMDTAVSLHYGNLDASSPSWRMVRRLYDAGWVSATLSGAPCETFSEARHMAPPSDIDPNQAAKWPRPLRSAADLFGLEGLTHKELRQVRQGSAFFMQNVETMLMSYVKGGVYIGEHPAMPMDDTRASIWSSPIVQLLRYHDSFDLHHIAQWRWGAPAVKPTGLLSVGLPNFMRSLWRRCDPDPIFPEAPAIGKDSDPSGPF